MSNLLIQQAGEMIRSLDPRSVHHIPPSRLNTCIHHMCSPSSQHIASHIKAENMNDKTIDNTHTNVAVALLRSDTSYYCTRLPVYSLLIRSSNLLVNMKLCSW